MKPGDFDHERAWRELARPAFDCLPADIRDLYELIRVDYGHLIQGPNLDVNWPEDPGLRRLFDDLDSEYLAQAAAVVYHYGHWSPEGGDGGAYWRFSSLADWVLRRRLDLPRDFEGHGLGFRIHEGALRLCHSTRDSWQWQDVALATPQSLATCRVLVVDGDYEASLVAIKKVRPGSWFAHDMLDTRDFIVKTPAEAAIDDVLRFSGLGRHDLIHVNHRPHPFMITVGHIEHAPGGILDPNTDKCGVRGCNLSYAEHESDHVVVIAGLTQPVSDDHLAVVKAMAPVLEEHGLDYMVFLEA